MNMANSVNIHRDLYDEASRILCGILEDSAGLRAFVDSRKRANDQGYDLLVQAQFGDVPLRFGVQVRSRITPQTSLAMVQSMAFAPSRTIPVLFAPVISQRVADNIRSVPNCGWVDGAGNCRLRSTDPLFLVNRGASLLHESPLFPQQIPFHPSRAESCARC